MTSTAQGPSFSDLTDCMSSAELLYGDAVIVREICGMMQDQFPSVTYWFDGGSLIGALRHNSFVPYDDDIDLCVMYDEFLSHLPAIYAAVEELGYTMKAWKGVDGREVMKAWEGVSLPEVLQSWLSTDPAEKSRNGWRMPTYWQVFLTPHKAKQILTEIYGRAPTRKELKAYLEGDKPYLDFLLVWQKPDGHIQYVGDYYGNQPYHPKDVFPLKRFDLLGMSVPIPRRPVHYLKTSYKTDKSPVTNAVIWAEHKAKVKPICNQRLRTQLLHGTILADMNRYLKRIFGKHLRVTTKHSLKKYD